MRARWVASVPDPRRPNTSAGRRFERAHQAQQRRLARAAAADQQDELASVDRERDVREGEPERPVFPAHPFELNESLIVGQSGRDVGGHGSGAVCLESNQEEPIGAARHAF